MKNIMVWLLLAALVAFGMYGMVWIGKHLSYSWFYENLVQQTVKEMVREEALK